MNEQLGVIARNELSVLMKPPPERSAWEWADANRILPRTNAEPGKWRSSRVPWTIPITETVKDSRYQMIVVIMGSQCSKTETLFNIIGWKLDDDPAPMLYIGPTRNNIEGVSKNRIMPMIESTPSLFQGLRKGKKNKVTEKYINGARVGFGWAGSVTELASNPAAMVFIDERSRMTDTNEGDPVALLRARIATYPGGKLIVTSTPTEGILTDKNYDNGLNFWEFSEEVSCPTWALWQQGTGHEWAIPCPDCEEYFVPRSNLLKFDENLSYSKIRETAVLVCPHCGAAIQDFQKTQMNAKGRFISKTQTINKQGEVNGNPPPNSTASFWISGLCSPWVSWGERAEELAKARASKNVGRIMAVMNTSFGELYGEKGDGISTDLVARLKQDYQREQVPSDVRGLTCGVDVQLNRLVFAIRGWAENMKSYGITHGEIWGDTTQPEVWEKLGELLLKDFNGHKITAMAVDSGYNAQPVYDFGRKHSNVHITKGYQTLNNPFTHKRLDVLSNGITLKSGLSLYRINTDYYKSWLMGAFKRDDHWFLARDVDDEYLKQITSEQRMRNAKGQAIWTKTYANHFFDCEVLNVFLCEMLKINLRPLPTPDLPKPNKPSDNDWVRKTNNNWLG
jgi:phage terminase large subunit GpA-like protein